MRSHGLGVGYRSPHDYEGADVDQQYLPDKLVGRRYYEPTDQGWEARIRERMDALMVARKQGSRKRR
jgi:putative ATPase